MKTIKALIKSHPLLSFYAIAFAISWGGVIIPVTTVDGRLVSSGQHEPVASRLREAYWDLHWDPRFTLPVDYDRSR